MIRRSLLARLIVRLALITILAMISITAIVLWQFAMHVDTMRDRSLQGQARDIVRHIALQPDGMLHLALPDYLVDEYDASSGNYLYAVLDVDGGVIFASDGRTTPLFGIPDRWQKDDSGQVEFTNLLRGENARYFGIVIAAEVAGKQLFVQAAQGPSHGDVIADTFLEEFWSHAAWILIAFSLVVLLVVSVTVRQSLKPLRNLSSQASEIGPEATGLRLSDPDLPQEVVPLVDAVNGALERIQESYRHQKEFTANAAHELRTPIAVLRSHVETLSDREVAANLTEEVVRLQRLVTQLLELERADTLLIRRAGDVELGALAVKVAGHLGPQAVKAGKTIEVSRGDGPVTVRGDEGYLGIALRNLIENALNHTPAGTEVEVAVSEHGLSVSDHGPGVGETERPLVFERFWRNPKTKAGSAGLGLSIVKRIADAHGAKVEVGDAPGGGARFSLIFSDARQIPGQTVRFT